MHEDIHSRLQDSQLEVLRVDSVLDAISEINKLRPFSLSIETAQIPLPRVISETSTIQVSSQYPTPHTVITDGRTDLDGTFCNVSGASFIVVVDDQTQQFEELHFSERGIEAFSDQRETLNMKIYLPGERI